jgi:hypothetical protein
VSRGLDRARHAGDGDPARPPRLVVTGNSYRHPTVLAKVATRVDIISGGRLMGSRGAVSLAMRE